ncbi:hypothetical protein CAPTEDRAFT_227777 [Capitella teleta]|uniref:Myb-like, SWIRM and MPN domain-containing protein 1 n=1 Tax=Capitella teleta TaxID=283909 RepID=R7VCK5_CAPTE|nr:hypothetical protein CAPTEDRAFT_227777 [Capitella teleta]|eukprot:ELU16359.1 hypothetical protein CAPTEDRAFT_227777 [Capitella teleta]
MELDSEAIDVENVEEYHNIKEHSNALYKQRDDVLQGLCLPDELPSHSSDLSPEYYQHPWKIDDETDINLDHCADEKDRKAIEQMLFEERVHVMGGRRTADRKLKATTSKKSVWSDEEKAMFNSAFDVFGRRWTKISHLINSKSVDEVKSYGRKHLKMVDPSSASKPRTPTKKGNCSLVQTAEVVKIQHDSDSAASEIDILDVSDEEDLSKPESKVNAAVENSPVKVHADLSNGNTVEEEEAVNVGDVDDLRITEEDTQIHPPNVLEREDEFPLTNYKGEIVYLPNPTKELMLEKEVVSQSEKEFHFDFFDGSGRSRNPQRYLKIRNFILESWEKCRPNYLYKTGLRVGLKNCGDVNLIGRIHSYLEQVGAINFSCERAQYRLQRKQAAANSKAFPTKSSPVHTSGSRKRRVRDESGEWVEPQELEGRTIPFKEDSIKKYKVTSKRPTDPFTLVKCQQFDCGDDPVQSPYSVTVETVSIVTMTVHAHLSHMEVIGLLGGRLTDELQIKMAVPCDSLSTSMQCDMDPVSQATACEAIRSAGYDVVGWYHSHPVFEPNPSVRDLETQQKYQEWFAKEGSPFVGLIVSPWLGTARISDIRCLLVKTSSDLSPDKEGNQSLLPFSFVWTPSHHLWNMSELEQQLTQLAQKYSQFQHKVPLTSSQEGMGTQGCLEKLLSSLSLFLPDSFLPQESIDFEQRISQILLQHYGDISKLE